MTQEIGDERWTEQRFENEPSDEWTSAYSRGGPVRSDEPERDYFFENSAAPSQQRQAEPRQLQRMSWRAEGAQDYPGGALDQLIEASHRGKGPKGYRPSDARLREVVCEALTEDAFIDATDIEVSAANGEVTLTGTVAARAMKFAAEDLVSELQGVETVHNELRIH